VFFSHRFHVTFCFRYSCHFQSFHSVDENNLRVFVNAKFHYIIRQRQVSLHHTDRSAQYIHENCGSINVCKPILCEFHACGNNILQQIYILHSVSSTISSKLTLQWRTDKCSQQGSSYYGGDTLSPWWVGFCCIWYSENSLVAIISYDTNVFVGDILVQYCCYS